MTCVGAYLQVREERQGKTRRHYYRVTVKGRKALSDARRYVSELSGEMTDQ